MSNATQVNESTTCFGVGCHTHHRCGRYLAVDGQRDSDRVATCVTPQGTYPHYTETINGQPGGDMSGAGRSAGAAVAARHFSLSNDESAGWPRGYQPQGELTDGGLVRR